MDSIYEVPRCAPKPAFSNNRFDSPVVPEVSLLLQNSSSQQIRRPSEHEHTTYNVWKVRNQMQQKENLSGNVNREASLSFQESRKQVRFESQQSTRKLPSVEKPCLQSGNFYNYQQEKILPFRNDALPSSTIISKPFEQIYMENIPNRHLDLSIIDAPTTSKSQTNQNALLERPNLNVINSNLLDIRDNKLKTVQSPALNQPRDRNKQSLRNDHFYGNFTNKEKFYHEEARNCNFDKIHSYGASPNNDFLMNANKVVQHKAEDEPTTKDLLKIIQQQNEQILMLQKQVSGLLNVHEQFKQIEPPNNFCNYGLRNTQLDSIPVFGKTPEKGPPNPKFAIDVMTSFEVSIRPQQSFARNKLLKDCLYNEPKISEIVEPDSPCKETVDNTVDKSDCSLVINEPIRVPEDTPSPENSIHVDMQDYSSDSDDDFITSDLGWTIYNNIMGQVNNVLKRKASDHEENGNFDKVKEQTMKKVKAATLRHLQNIGVNVNKIPGNSDSSSDSSKSTNLQEFNANEISFAVKQLLMKYLPNEELTKIINNTKQVPLRNNDCLIKGNKRRPELSFATMQYMRKYNLIECDKQPQVEAKPQQRTPKFLDITALKQQPKLL